ncbi:MAG: class II SORL domain-containing protein [Bacillota bacterium]
MSIAEYIKGDDWKTEKHVPVIEAPEVASAGERVSVKVTVGKGIPHPNTTAHHIAWTKVMFVADGATFPVEVADYQFSARSDPESPAAVQVFPSVAAELEFERSGTLVAVSYCNLHGLWESQQRLDVV